MNTIVSEAINEKKTLSFFYDGGIRTVEPFCYGISTKGNEVLRAFQTGGHSESGKLGWKLFRVDEMSSISTSNSFQGDREGYKRGDRHIPNIFCEI